MSIKLVVVALIAILGLYFVTHPKQAIEGYVNSGSDLPYRCPNLLIQNGAELELRNTRLANVPGVNPIKFENLNQYVEFTKWQRSQGIRCPVLFLQHTYDTQGRSVYKARPGPTNLMGGAPDLFPRSVPMNQRPAPLSKLFDASRDDPPYNKRDYPGFDSHDQYIGLYTPLDKMFHREGGGPSPNPMDTTWAGQKYSQDLVDAGYYKEDEV